MEAGGGNDVVIITGASMGLGAALAGCTSYYKITDPSNGKTYYTNNYSQAGQGSVKFKDAQTGSEVTIQNSNISQLKKEQYESDLMAANAPKPAAK